MKVAVIGTGYVGLVAGACFADSGNEVICVDRDASKVNALRQGIIPIYEPGLEDLVKRGVAEHRLSFTTDTAAAVQDSEVIFMAVGTPSRPDGQPDLQYLEAASREVGRGIKGYKVIVNKSTVPIGAHLKVAEWIAAETSEKVDVVSNPEFLKEGSAIDDFLKPDRVVIGTNSDAAFEKMSLLYGPFVRQGNPIIRMDPVSAEMTKYACNSFLATRISFMNELSVLCDRVGGDIELVRKGMSTDVRIGKHFLYAGVGYGGSCFPKDIAALVTTGRSNDVRMGIIEAAQDANLRQRQIFMEKVLAAFDGDISGKTFALWGLAFKPNTDDLREAPALTLIEMIESRGGSVRLFDPVAMEHCEKLLPPSKTRKYCESSYDALTGADALLLVTEWNEFRTPDWNRVKSLLVRPWVFDGRNIYDPAWMKKQGFRYCGIGRS
ncbi:UDP-glucose/GDP-mannose dehydrogenase family protein [bacterium]|nr:UDP-glucose/GDP-mannose dehydrogenase family protein [bacterium]